MTAFTLFELAGRKLSPPPLAEATLILIDYQNVYLSGRLALPGSLPAVQQARRLLDTARRAGSRIIHIAHAGAAGGMFDRRSESGAIISELSPDASESLVEKPRPNAFSGTNLGTLIGTSRQKLIIAGFMTHNCVSSTTRAALDLGHEMTVVADACATRDLPGPHGEIKADIVHQASLAALGDHHALITDVETLTGR